MWWEETSKDYFILRDNNKQYACIDLVIRTHHFYLNNLYKWGIDIPEDITLEELKQVIETVCVLNKDLT